MSILNDLTAQGWRVQIRSQPAERFPAALLRYPQLPPVVLEFLSGVAHCVSADGMCWFLMAEDFYGESGAAIRWNECELRCMAESAGRHDELRDVEVFWKRHCPLAYSTRAGLVHASLDVLTTAVVLGSGPRYDELEPAAATFEEFLLKLVTHDPAVQAFA
jgi:hypothetical protein